MSRSFISLVAVSLGICLTACFCVSHESPWARAADAPASKISAEDFLVQGQPLKYWIAQTTAKEPAVDRGKVIAALAEAVGNNDATVKVAAADALATFGPDSKAAMPALLPLLSDSRPWVSSAGITSLAAIGKEAVPTLIDHYQNGPAAARIRAAFALGGIGRDAQAAVPVLAAAMEKESPVMQERLQGILSLIDPEKYPAPTIVGKAKFEQGEAATSDQPAAMVGDWPQFHGPLRDNICRETGLLQSWPEGGPRLLWQIEGLGTGYSMVSVGGGRLFTMGDRPDASAEGGKSQFVIAYDLQNHNELWATRVGPPHEDGPRCTPTVDGDLLYVLGTEGDLVCLETATGAVRWQKNLTRDFDGKMMSVWKYSESPLVDGDKVICTPGGPKDTMVALNKLTGDTLWNCTMPEIGKKGTDGAAYSSAVVADIAGVRQYVQFVGRGVIGVDAATGRFLWGYNPVANTVANCTTPIVRGNYVFGSSAYSTGSALLKVSRSGDAFIAEEVYFIPPSGFQNHHGGVVLVGDYVYGGHGPNRGDPACITFGTGDIVWKQRSPSRGSAAVLYADGNLIFRYDRGEVLLIEATPEEMRIKGRFTPPQGDGPAWSHPVIHQGRLYLRHGDLLLCYDVRAIE